MRYHVAVIGAGPGGAILAGLVARKGVSVTVYEKGDFENLGHDWSDAMEIAAFKATGFEVPRLQGDRWEGDLVKDYAAGRDGLFEPHAIPRLKLFSPDYNSIKEVDFRMLTTDRRALGRELIRRAAEAGAAIKYRHEGVGLLYREKGSGGLDGVEVYGVAVRNLETGEQEEIKADIVVESSGFQCTLRRSLPASTGLAANFKESDFALVHREVRIYDPDATDPLPDHYRYGFHTGYQWSHIHEAGRIDVGAGVRHDPANPDPRDIIEEFISRHPSIKDTRLRGGRSLCIVGRPLPNFVTSGFVVLGDAASTSVPTTGCGAGSAMLNGLWAAETIIEAAADGRSDIAKLWEFNRKFYLDSDRGARFAALSGLRTVLQDLDHDSINFLFSREIMDAPTLQNAVNGIFTAPDLGTKMRSLLRGAARPAVLAKLNLATTGGANILKHHQVYPERWDPAAYNNWQAEAEKLFRKAGA